MNNRILGDAREEERANRNEDRNKAKAEQQSNDEIQQRADEEVQTSLRLLEAGELGLENASVDKLRSAIDIIDRSSLKDDPSVIRMRGQVESLIPTESKDDKKTVEPRFADSDTAFDFAIGVKDKHDFDWSSLGGTGAFAKGKTREQFYTALQAKGVKITKKDAYDLYDAETFMNEREVTKGKTWRDAAKGA